MLLGAALFQDTSFFVLIVILNEVKLSYIGLNHNFGVNSCFCDSLLSGHADLVPILLNCLLDRGSGWFEKIIFTIFVLKILLCERVSHYNGVFLHLLNIS